VSSLDIALARQQWEEGSRRLESTREADPSLYLSLLRLVDLVTAELRGRIGQTFTLDELAEEYERADDWSRAAVEESEPPPPAGWPRHLSTVADFAFREYARGATDYEP
jgi:hypothetical protein